MYAVVHFFNSPPDIFTLEEGYKKHREDKLSTIHIYDDLEKASQFLKSLDGKSIMDEIEKER